MKLLPRKLQLLPQEGYELCVLMGGQQVLPRLPLQGPFLQRWLSLLDSLQKPREETPAPPVSNVNPCTKREKLTFFNINTVLNGGNLYLCPLNCQNNISVNQLWTISC